MAEEFDESEIVFSEDLSYVLGKEYENKNHLFGLKKRNKTRQIVKSMEKVTADRQENEPDNILRRYVGKEEDEHSEEEEEEEYSNGGREIVPPHVIVGRRIQGGDMAFSVCSGIGRTLKGRDLSRVRNSVLRLTGFLEA